MAGQKSPKREEFGSPSLDFCRAIFWEEFGSPSLDFWGTIFFAGLSAGHFAGISPASVSPAKSSAKGTEQDSRSNHWTTLIERNAFPREGFFFGWLPLVKRRTPPKKPSIFSKDWGCFPGGGSLSWKVMNGKQKLPKEETPPGEWGFFRSKCVVRTRVGPWPKRLFQTVA